MAVRVQDRLLLVLSLNERALKNFSEKQSPISMAWANISLEFVCIYFMLSSPACILISETGDIALLVEL